ncbi:putative RNA-directed DNA polymerase from transposon X-element [Trichonephila inaurata madagascariensis]|uniref:Putative RNA-directed DNA polymerase from transposon X-element n=1 Tax=Trichonephila inaurata madagascariensis TaxID=2747483 RepID=A0A8X7CB10_9ARAC|nr:putative RNA-directed DNA polymerase from transposon X-element [Trichonephila inaurata madagascariensis]
MAGPSVTSHANALCYLRKYIGPCVSELIPITSEKTTIGSGSCDIILNYKYAEEQHCALVRRRRGSAKALNILKVLANIPWGADRTSLLRLYRALIRSKLDYGSVVYSSACKSLLKILDPVHQQALRLCLGAFRTSPVESLYAETYKPPLDLQRNHRSSLTYSQPFHLRIRDLINDLNLNIGRIALCKISEVPPWKVIYPKTPCQPFKALSLYIHRLIPSLWTITYALANHLKKKDIRFCWIPGHAEITGNELADTAARSETCSSERFPIPHSDLKACFRQKLQSVWQSNWDQQTENKLHSVMPVLAPTVPSSSNRREQVPRTHPPNA